ncbi:hypothetical protein F4804DRAFT_297101 [Jackrogersella minutella]|nr:hypothetical protein F4804DRAFT_297101 [Jackrogersella minutella]
MEKSSPNLPPATKVGRTPKRYANRALLRTTPYNSSQARSSDRKKREVLTWIVQTRIPLQPSKTRPGLHHITRQIPAPEFTPLEPGFRRPTFREAAAFFKLNAKTISYWWHKRDDILKGNLKKHPEEQHPQLRNAPRNQGNVADAADPATTVDSCAPELGGDDLDEDEVIESLADTIRSPYSRMTVKELKESLKGRELAQNGNKAVLVERLLRNDIDSLDLNAWFG